MSPWYAQFLDGRALVIGSCVVLLGALVLFLAWRRPKRHAGLLALSWGAMAASFWFWSDAAGIDVGATIGTVLIMLIALVFVLANGDWRAKSRERAVRETGVRSALEGHAPEPGRTRTTVLRTLAAGPLAFLAGLALSLLVAGLARWPEADRIVIGACVLLVVWPIAMVWSCATSRPQRSAVLLGVVALLGSLALLPLSF
jgi:hypothetical protein